MKQGLVALFAGILFGIGLAVSGMADPARVQGFLDLFGLWDPTLAFVMGGAIIPMAIAWTLRKRWKAPLAASGFHIPDSVKIDKRLAGGAIFFGMGWGISGLCPGPALVDLAINPLPAIIFSVAMLAGMAGQRFAA